MSEVPSPESLEPNRDEEILKRDLSSLRTIEELRERQAVIERVERELRRQLGELLHGMGKNLEGGGWIGLGRQFRMKDGELEIRDPKAALSAEQQALINESPSVRELLDRINQYSNDLIIVKHLIVKQEKGDGEKK